VLTTASPSLNLKGLPLQADRKNSRMPPVPDAGVILHLPDRTGFVAAIGNGRIKRASDYARLESDRIWVTDLPYQEWADRTLRRPNTRHNAFLRTPLPDLLSEWAIEDQPSAQAADAIWIVVARVLRLFGSLVERYRADGLKVLSDPLSESSLNGGLATVFQDSGLTRGARLDNAPTRLPEALAGAWQTGARNASHSRVPRGSQAVWMKRHRLEHALDVLGGRFPSGDWRWIEGNAVDDPLGALSQAAAPALVNMSWRARPGNELVSELFDWKQVSAGGSRIRSWATLEEALFLSQVADIQVRGALVCDGWSSVDMAGRLLAAFCDGKANPALAAGLSWSASLVAECVLGGFLKTPPATHAPTASAVWASWRDRHAMLRAALVFTDAGIPVRNTYLGGVNVIVSDETLPAALDAAWRAGLVPPLSLVQRALSLGLRDQPDPQGWGGDPRYMPLALSFRSGWRSVLIRFDELIELPGHEVEAAYLAIEESL